MTLYKKPTGKPEKMVTLMGDLEDKMEATTPPKFRKTIVPQKIYLSGSTILNGLFIGAGVIALTVVGIIGIRYALNMDIPNFKTPTQSYFPTPFVETTQMQTLDMMLPTFIDLPSETPSLTELVQSTPSQTYTPANTFLPFATPSKTPYVPTSTKTSQLILPTATRTPTPVPPTATSTKTLVPPTPTATNTKTLVPPTPTTVFDVYDVWIDASDTSYTGSCPPPSFEFWENFTWSGTGYVTVEENGSSWDKYVNSLSGISTSNTHVTWTRNDITTGNHTITWTYKILSPRVMSASQDFKIYCLEPPPVP